MAAQLAKLAGSVSLNFHTQLREGQYMLLEVNEAILKEITASEFDPLTKTAKNMVEFRGANTDEAALCTGNKTYSVRLVESSNTQLLVCANPSNMFLPLEADELDAYAGAAAAAAVAASDSNPSPLKRQKLAAAVASSSSSSDAAADIYVPQRLIRGMVQHHYEVTEILPRLHVLRELLGMRLYAGDEEDEEAEAKQDPEDEEVDMTAFLEEDDAAEKQRKEAKKLAAAAAAAAAPPDRFDTAALRRLVQASDAQLRAGLESLEAFEDRQGHWRMLHPDLTAKVFDSVLDFCVEKGWEHAKDGIPATECAEGLKELYEPRVTKHVIKIFSKPHAAGTESDLYTLNSSRVCLLRAQQLLAIKEPYPHLDFMRDWQSRVPEGMKVDVSVLRGHALCETSTALEALARSASGSLSLGAGGRPSEESTLVWRYLSLASLSPLIKTRFQQLFDRRLKWKLADIEAYTNDLCAPGQTLEQLLLKHARPITAEVNGARVILYTKK